MNKLTRLRCRARIGKLSGPFGRSLVVTVAFCLLSGCMPPLLPDDLQGTVSAITQADGVHITNNTNKRIFYHIFPKNILPTIEYCLGCDPNRFRNLPKNSSGLVPYNEIFEIQRDEELVIIWWYERCSADGARRQASETRWIELKYKK